MNYLVVNYGITDKSHKSHDSLFDYKVGRKKMIEQMLFQGSILIGDKKIIK